MKGTEEQPLADPPRLMERADALGELLRLESSREPTKGRSDVWDLLREQRRRRGQRSWLALATACFVLGWFFISTHAQAPEEPLAISAEPLAPPSRADGQELTAPLPPARPQRQDADSIAKRADQPAARRAVSIAPRPQKPRSRRIALPADQKTNPEPVAPDCPALTQAGKYAQAVECYSEQARSNGVSAELALLEKARLESRVFGDETAALASLDEYQARFPSGALFREATLARIEALDALGRASEARQAIDGALHRIPEKEGQLSLLAARLAAQAGDCEVAARHLERARSFGESTIDLANHNPNCAQTPSSAALSPR